MSAATTNQEEQEQIINEVIDFVINGMWFIVDITDHLKYKLDPTASKPMDCNDLETLVEIEEPPTTIHIDYTPIKCFQKKFEPLRSTQAAMNNCSRSEDPYLELVNEAVYGNPDNHPKEETPDYYKAAECFAIYGKAFLDLIKDPDYQKDVNDSRPSSKPLNPYAPNILFSKETEFNTPLSLATYPNIGASTNNPVYPFQPNSQYPVSFVSQQQQSQQNMKIQQMAKSLYKNAINTSALNAAQQFLLQANQQSNYNHNIMSYPFYPTLNQPLLYANPMLASSYFNAWVKETQINTAIFQQQHYNVYENNMLIYAQMLQQTQKITQTVIAANKFQKQMSSNVVQGISDLNEGETSSSSGFIEDRSITSSSNQTPATPPIKILTKTHKDQKTGPSKSS